MAVTVPAVVSLQMVKEKLARAPGWCRWTGGWVDLRQQEVMKCHVKKHHVT